MLGPFATASRRTPPVLHCHSPGVATVARRLRIDVHNNNDNARQRGPLWPHRMGPMMLRGGYEETAVVESRLHLEREREREREKERAIVEMAHSYTAVTYVRT